MSRHVRRSLSWVREAVSRFRGGGTLLPAWRLAVGEVPEVSFSDCLTAYQRDPSCKAIVDFLADQAVGMGFLVIEFTLCLGGGKLVSKIEVWTWAERQPAVMRWLNRLAPSTRRNYLRFCYLFFEWLKGRPGFEDATVDGLLEEQRVNGGYRQLDALQDYIGTLRGRRSWKELVYTAVRSFYAHNRVELPRDRGFRIEGDQDPVVGNLTIDGVRRIILAMPLRMRAAFMCRWMSAMGCGEFLRWNLTGWPRLKEQLETGVRLVRVDIPGRKRNRRPYYTFFGGEAIRILREYLEKERGPIRHGEAIFINTHGRPLSDRAFRDVFKRAAFRVGVIERAAPICPNCRIPMKWTRKTWPSSHPTIYECLKCGHKIWGRDAFPLKKRARVRYGANPHEMRDVWKSEWHRSGADLMVADFMMGHTIDPLGYDKIMKLHPEYAEEQYLKAEPYLSLSRPVNTREAVATLEERLRREQRALRRELSAALRLLAEGKVRPEEIARILEET